MTTPKPGTRSLLAACAWLALGAAHAQKAPYQPIGDCGGLPRVDVATPDGFCVGIVASGLRFPRGVLPLANGDLIVADMGGWAENIGTIWRLRKAASGGYTRTRLFEKVDRPHGLALGPDGLVYVGVVKRVFRFDPSNPKASPVDVIGGDSGSEGLPGAGRHPLTSFVFDRNGDVFVSVGSMTDNCEGEGGSLPDRARPCPETEGPAPHGVIRKYVMQWPQGKVTGWTNYARGLRNSLALAVHPTSNRLVQAENSRDAIHLRVPGMKNDEDLPHDELNLIEQGAHYGWPYCYDNSKPSPEFPQADCARYRDPAMLLPAHAAPLGMTYYFGKQFPAEYRGHLLVAYHGHRKQGHRLVMIPADKNGMPLGGGRDLIGNWIARKGQRMGTPVDIKTGPDGAVYLTEDRNGTVLRLTYRP